MLRALAHFTAILAFFAVLVSAQPAAKPLEFEVAAIKPTDPDAHGSSLMVDRSNNFNVKNLPVRAVITFAYNIRDFQLSGGPGWIGTERYDITAKPDRGDVALELPDPRTMSDQQRNLRDDQLRERVRSLLADRLGLVVHKETKEQQVYVLSVAKNGPKLTVVTTPGDRQGTSGGRGRSQGFAASIGMLTRTLSDVLGRPVVDKTGLSEKYDYVLEWTPDVAAAGPESSDRPQPVDSPGPTIFTALQEQLGLKLESSKGPVETIVIDHVDRPSAN